MAMLITSRKGKALTAGMYLHLKEMADAKRSDEGPACVHGHFGCALWDGGPCFDEVTNSLPETHWRRNG